MKEKRISDEDEAMNNLVKAVLKSGDVKTVFDVEDKLKKSFGKIIQEMLEEENKKIFRNGKEKKLIHLKVNSSKF